MTKRNKLIGILKESRSSLLMDSLTNRIMRVVSKRKKLIISRKDPIKKLQPNFRTPARCHKRGKIPQSHTKECKVCQLSKN